MEETFFSNVFLLFVVYNAIGQVPVFLALLSPYDSARQRKIIIRESLIALFVLIIFDIFGKNVLKAMGIDQPVFSIAGGLLLILIAMTLIFPKAEKATEGLPPIHHDPIIVPLAIPGLAGPGSITTIIVLANKMGMVPAAGALLTAWIPSTLILFAASYFKKFLGEKGLKAIERLGGMLICLIGVQMLASGSVDFVKDKFFVPEKATTIEKPVPAEPTPAK